METYQGALSSGQGLGPVNTTPKSAQTIDAIRNVLFDIRGKLGYILPDLMPQTNGAQATSAIHPLQRDLENLLEIATSLKNDIIL